MKIKDSKIFNLNKSLNPNNKDKKISSEMQEFIVFNLHKDEILLKEKSCMKF